MSEMGQTQAGLRHPRIKGHVGVSRYNPQAAKQLASY